MTGIKADSTSTTNYWTSCVVTFEDGSMVTEYIPGPLSQGQKTERWGTQGHGDMRDQRISKARFEAAIKARKFTRN